MSYEKWLLLENLLWGCEVTIEQLNQIFKDNDIVDYEPTWLDCDNEYSIDFEDYSFTFYIIE